MALLADFSERVDLPSGPVWPAYGHVGLWLAPPTQVTLAQADGEPPLFHLSLIRSDTPDEPPEPFGLLDLTLQASRNLDAQLNELRTIVSGATLLPAQLNRAELGLAWEEGVGGSELQTGVSAIWQNSGQTRIVEKMDLMSALAMAGQLETGTSPLIMRGAVSIVGVSPRLPTIVAPEATLATILSAELGSSFTRDALVFALSSMGLLAAANANPELGADRVVTLAEAMADRITQIWCVIVGRRPSNLPLYSFSETIEPAEWDLARPFSVSRWLALDQSTATTLTDHIRDHGIDQIITRNVIPRFPKGRHQITVHANLPLAAPSVHMLNVSLFASPNPPDRPSAAHASGQVNLTSGLVTAELTLALGEPLSYTAECFAVIGEGADIRQVMGKSFVTNRQVLTVTADDFGMQVLHHRVDPGLLQMANLTLTQSYVMQDAQIDTTYTLDNIEVIAVLPIGATDGSLQLTAREKDGAGEIILPVFPLVQLDITLALFQSYGRQDVVIKMVPPPSNVVGIDVLPGHTGEADLQTFAFTSDRDERSFTYNAERLFAPGFRWRITGSQDWNLHSDPTQPLQVDAPA